MRTCCTQPVRDARALSSHCYEMGGAQYKAHAPTTRVRGCISTQKHKAHAAHAHARASPDLRCRATKPSR
eukprot:6187084-Pleurochrysis_carterae.AAC.3